MFSYPDIIPIIPKNDCMISKKISLTGMFCISPCLFALSAFAQATNKLDSVGSVGIGTLSPVSKLHVNAALGTRQASFTYDFIPYTEANLRFENATSNPTQYIPYIIGRSKADTRPYGIYITGEAADATPVLNDVFAAAVILDGRSKSNTRLQANNVLAINSGGANLMMVKADGSVGIGTIDTRGYKLAVNGSAIFTKVKVKSYSAWPDFVFHEDYRLRPLSQLEQFIKTNKHLPEMPSADEVEKEGQDLAEINRKLLQKVEELTLYIIEQNKKNEQLETRLKQVEERVNN